MQSPSTNIAAVLAAVSLVAAGPALASSHGDAGNGQSSSSGSSSSGSGSSGSNTGTSTASNGDSDTEADEGGGGHRTEVGRQVRCSLGSRMVLEIEREDGLLEVELEVDGPRARVAWRIVLLHERTIVLRKLAWTAKSSGSFEVRTRFRDWEGAEAVTARATALSGETCRVTVVL